MIELAHATLWREGDVTVTRMRLDHAIDRSEKPDDPDQRKYAQWTGCGDDLGRYNWEHEVIHSFLAEKMWGRESYVVSRQARGIKMAVVAALFEERWVYHFHCYLSNVGPALEPEWPAWRDELVEILGREA